MQDPDSPFKDSQHVPADARLEVLQWLTAFRKDRSRNLVLDRGREIWREYMKNLSKEDLGRKVVVDKIQSAIRYVTVQAEHHDSAVAAAVHDPSDRKFVATALADEGNSSIVNACDTDWYDCEDALSKDGIVVEQLIDGWCRKLHQQKLERK
jgi:predicted nucleic acid-binding protein